MAAALVFCAPCFALSLPDDAVKYINKQFPKSVIRFDGLIVLSDGTEYLPVIPAISQVDAGMKIKKSFPQTNDIKTKPDIVVFENNFALIKINYTEDKKARILNLPDYPIEIKTGLLPQELIVPTGLILPETLHGILGDLEIPLYPISSIVPMDEISGKGEDFKTTTMSSAITKSTFKGMVETMKTSAPDWNADFMDTLSNKRYLITNLSSEYINIVPSDSSEPKFTLKLDTIPLDMALTTDEEYLLITKLNNTNVDLVDIDHEEIIKRIDLGVNLNEILVAPDNKTVFVTSMQDRSIFILDLNSLKVLKKIQVQGMPEKLALSDNQSKLLYYDKMSSKLYCIDLKDKYIATLIDKYENASKFIFENNKIYALLRQNGELNVRNYVPPEYKGDEELVRQAAEKRLLTEEMENQKNNSVIMGSTDTLDQSSPDNAAIPKARKQYKFKELNYRDKNTVLPLMIEEEVKKENKGIDIKVGSKPVDMIKYNDFLYILSAKDRTMNVFSIASGKKVGTIKLPVGGFPNKITQVGKTNIALITNVTEGSYVVFDLAGAQVIEVCPISIPVNNILVIKDKK